MRRILLFLLLVASLISCDRSEKRELPRPESLLFSGRKALKIAEERGAPCDAVARENDWQSCYAIDFDIGWGDTVRIWWLDYPDVVSSWKSQLRSMDTTSFSVERTRLVLRLPEEMALPTEAMHELRLQWPSESADGTPLFNRFPIREVDRGKDGLQSDFLLGVRLEGVWACRSYRNGGLLWCWSLEKIPEEKFVAWRLHLPLTEVGEREWETVRQGRASRVVERGGHVGVLSGMLSPDSLSKILKNFLSLQAWSK